MISILTVNYHSSHELIALARSLHDHPADGEMELIVTNNSASDRIDTSRISPLPVRVVDADNIGFARGVNMALTHARGDVLLIANPDLRVKRGALESAMSFLSANRDVGVLLPRLLYPDGRVQPSVRRFYTWAVAMYARFPLRGVLPHPRFFRQYLYEDVSLGQPTDVDWGLGGAMFLRRADFPDGRIFDERFFLYFEDVDLCYRTWEQGRRVVYCPQIECVHAHERSSRNPVSFAGYLHMKSFLKFVGKHGGLPQRPAQR